MATSIGSPNALRNSFVGNRTPLFLWWVVVAVLALCGVLGMFLAGAYGGAFAALDGFSDGGPFARYGLPLARTVHDVFGTVTVGLLLLAGTILPDTTSTRRRETACRLGAMTGVVWVVAGTVTMLLLISNVAGVPVGDAAFLSTVSSFVWSIDLFRVYLISVLIALAVVVGAATARSKTTMVWMAALSVGALLPLALAGHSGGSLSHDTAVNSLAVHLAAAFVWCGGLAAILILWPILGTATSVVVQRYSVLAAWALGGVALSGVLNGAVRLGEWSQVTSRYGLLLVGKVALLALLAAAGWRMRASIVKRLAEGRVQGAFVRLAAVEISIMALAMGAGAGLARSQTPVPRSAQADPDVAIALTGYPAPTQRLSGWDWFTVWRADWLWLAVSLLAVGVYVWAVVRLHHRGDSWPVRRTMMWTFGWLLFVWTTSGAPGVYGRVQFSTHMFMHMMLTMGIPVFLAVGAPLSLLSRALPARRDRTMGPREILLATAHSRWLTFWANPVVASINFAGSLYIFYFTGLFELALRTHTGHVAMVVHFMLAGYVFCWSLIGIDPGPRRWPPSLRLVALFVTMSVHAFFGVAIMSATTLLAPGFFEVLHTGGTTGWVGDLLEDQQAGGGITWGIGEFPMLVLALLTALAWMRADESEARRQDRQADRDHDAALAAYNAELERRAEAFRRTEEAQRGRS
ncbi:cytochrome c oxidase assembly protein [Austwickia chelonae]|uniref:cytochrome c oxidase assembly protein n=1 Tax=Austwickia chelonae TaxID=100225 RepID=UPI001F0841D2|nr:cytochrome c oxidase assembly protein [Austwickia chelonae]